MTYVKIAYTEDVNMYEMLRQSELFSGMDEDEIKGCLNCGKAKITSYKRGEMIFLQTDTPDRLTVLLEGSVVVGSDSSDGRRSIVAAFDKPGLRLTPRYLTYLKAFYTTPAGKTAAGTKSLFPICSRSLRIKHTPLTGIFRFFHALRCAKKLQWRF